MHCFSKPFEKRVIFLKNTKRKFGGFFLNFFFSSKNEKLHGAWHICSLHYWCIVHTIVIKTGLSSKCFRCSILNTTTICLSLSHGCNARLCRFFVIFTLMKFGDIAIFIPVSPVRTVTEIVYHSLLWKLILAKGGQLCMTHSRGMKFARTLAAGVFSSIISWFPSRYSVGYAVREGFSRGCFIIIFRIYFRKQEMVEKEIELRGTFFFIVPDPIYFRGLFVDSGCNYGFRHALSRWSWSTVESHLHITTR